MFNKLFAFFLLKIFYVNFSNFFTIFTLIFNVFFFGKLAGHPVTPTPEVY